MLTFTKAQRLGTHIIVALFGESGSGKTYSAILLGRGLVGEKGRLALLDTERGRGLIYANLAGGYDYAELTPPFTPERYIDSIRDCEKAGYDAIIIDSATHEWSGIGGVGEIADSGTNKDGDPLKGLVKWAKPKARHKRFVQTLLDTKMHLIICLRAKEKLEQKGDKIVSAGYVPEQDKRFVFETTVQCFMPNVEPRGVPRLDKCPEDLLAAFPAGQKISTATGERIAEWVRGGAPVDHGAEAVKREAEDAANGGTTPLKALWARLTKDQQKALQPHMANLKSIAAVADKDAESQPDTGDSENGPPTDESGQSEISDAAEGAADVRDELADWLADKLRDEIEPATTVLTVNRVEKEIAPELVDRTDLLQRLAEACETKRRALAAPKGKK